MLHFTHTSVIDAPVEAVFEFHRRHDALELLTPPWTRVAVLRRSGGIAAGAVVELSVALGPMKRWWVAVHEACEENRLFVDVQREGPFRRWTHRHEFEDLDGRTRLTDRIEFSLPGGMWMDIIAGWYAKLELRRMFRYRHAVTRLHTECCCVP